MEKFNQNLGTQKSFEVQSQEFHQSWSSNGELAPFIYSYFSSAQKGMITKGKQKRLSLIRTTQEAASRASVTNELRGDFKNDALLSGTTGIGKSFNMEKALSEKGITNSVWIQGAPSMFHFGTQLMLEHFIFSQKRKTEEERLIIVIDDCDVFFQSKENINLLKQMTGERGKRVFQYNRALLEHMMTPEMIQIVEQYRNPNGAHGFRVDCDDIIFIITTNFNLPTENYANEYIKKNGPTPRANRLQDLAAVRRRFNTRDFILDAETNWGWLAYVTFEDKLVDKWLGSTPDSFQKKYMILEWVLNKWDKMTEHNLDTIKSMALAMVEHPYDFKDVWESEFIDAELSSSRL